MEEEEEEDLKNGSVTDIDDLVYIQYLHSDYIGHALKLISSSCSNSSTVMPPNHLF